MEKGHSFHLSVSSLSFGPSSQRWASPAFTNTRLTCKGPILEGGRGSKHSCQLLQKCFQRWKSEIIYLFISKYFISCLLNFLTNAYLCSSTRPYPSLLKPFTFPFSSERKAFFLDFFPDWSTNNTILTRKYAAALIEFFDMSLRLLFEGGTYLGVTLI